MKLLFVHDHIFIKYNDEIYSNTFSYTLLKRYRNIFSKITIIARVKEVNTPVKLSLASGKGIDFIFFKSISSVSSYFGLRKKYKKKIENILEKHDRVIVRVPSEFGMMTASLAKTLNKKYLVEVVGCAWDVMLYYGGWKSKVYAPFFYWKMRKSVREATYVIYVTTTFLQSRYPSSLAKTIALCDADVDKVEENIIIQRLMKIENKPQKIIFGTMTNLNLEYKGIDIAIRVLGNISNQNFEYRIMGGGESIKYREYAQRYGIASKIIFEGIGSGKKNINQWLDTIDIYLQPSRVEGLPRAVIEAMSRGCPVLASDIGGIPELLNNKMLFNPHKDYEFKNIINMLLKNNKSMKKEALTNYLKAKKFENILLDKERENFLRQFKEDILS